MHSVLLIDPKYPHNVGGALRACHLFGASGLYWTGGRVEGPRYEAEGRAPPGRLPREERMREYRAVDLRHASQDDVEIVLARWPEVVPVAVERRDNAEPLDLFDHPEEALYVFGPEDGTLGRATLSWCHRFVSIPSVPNGPLNLAAAVNVVLYDRFAKQRRLGEDDPVHPRWWPAEAR